MDRLPELVFKRKWDGTLTNKKLPKYLSFYDLVDEYMDVRNNILINNSPTREQMNREKKELTLDEIEKFSKSGHYNGFDLLQGAGDVYDLDYKLRYCAIRSLMVHAMEAYRNNGRFFELLPLVYKFYAPLFRHFYAYKLWEVATHHIMPYAASNDNRQYYRFGEYGKYLLSSCLTAFNKEFGEWKLRLSIGEGLVRSIREYMQDHPELFPEYERLYEYAEDNLDC